MSSLRSLAKISRDEGRITFFTPDQPCKHCGGIERYSRDNVQCVNCRHRVGRRDYGNVPQATFTGIPCRKCGNKERYSGNRNCVYCLVKRNDLEQHNPISKRKFLFQAARSRSKKYGKEFNILFEEIQWNDYCPVLGLKLDYTSSRREGKGKIAKNAATLDRVDNSKGYIKGNVQVISFRANSLKSNGTIEEFQKILKYMKNH